MSGIRLLIALLLISFALPALAQTPASTASKPALRPKAPRFLSIASATPASSRSMPRAFNSLDPKQKELAYWLSQASIAIDPIIYDQLPAYGIRQKRLLEEIVAHPQGIDPAAMKKITDFAKLFWANRGNHNDDDLAEVPARFHFRGTAEGRLTGHKNGAFRTPYADLPALASADAVAKELDDLKASLFDPNFRADDHRQESRKAARTSSRRARTPFTRASLSPI